MELRINRVRINCSRPVIIIRMFDCYKYFVFYGVCSACIVNINVSEKKVDPEAQMLVNLSLVVYLVVLDFLLVQT